MLYFFSTKRGFCTIWHHARSQVQPAKQTRPLEVPYTRSNLNTFCSAAPYSGLRPSYSSKQFKGCELGCDSQRNFDTLCTSPSTSRTSFPAGHEDMATLSACSSLPPTTHT